MAQGGRRSYSINPNKTELPGFYNSKRKTLPAGLLRLGLVKWPVAFCVLLILYYFWKHELHIEIQSYSRGWIKREIKSLRPLAPEGICWPPSSSYNTTLVDAPKHLQVHAGLSLEEDCFSFASLFPSQPIEGQVLPEQTTYHVYWRADLQPLRERSILLLQSILHTQSQEHSATVLWTNDKDRLLRSSSSLLQPLQTRYPNRFEIRQLDMHELAQNTPMATSPRLSYATDSKAWLDGDLVRLLLLYKHGGVWVDMDFLLLRDLRPLLETEWVVQWDAYAKPYSALNGAMMHFHQSSPYVCEMLYAMANEPDNPRKGTTDWGSLLYQKVWRRLVQAGRKPFEVLPWCFVDGRNSRLDVRLPDPFSSDSYAHPSRWKELEVKIDSIFAIHLHNQWSKTFPKKGWIRRMVLPKLGV